MNEKRFTWKTEKLQHLDDEVIIVVDNANKDWKGHILNIVDKLNELNNENERLKKENECLKMKNDKLDTETLLKLLVCIATSNRGWTDEERWFIKLLERRLFPDE